MITQFKNEYRWLSNFHVLSNPIEYMGLSYTTTEHFYQAMKCDNDEQIGFISRLKTPAEAKKAGRKISIRKDWDSIKLEVMLYAQRQKYKNEELKTMLLETGDKHIQEGNYWNDRFWGVCLKTGEGENNLGKIIMYVREEIKASQ